MEGFHESLVRGEVRGVYGIEGWEDGVEMEKEEILEGKEEGHSCRAR